MKDYNYRNMFSTDFTEERPSFRFMEMEPDSIDMDSVKTKAIKALTKTGYVSDIISESHIGSEGRCYFYLYFKVLIGVEEQVIKSVKDQFVDFLSQKKLFIVFNHKTKRKVLTTQSVETLKSEPAKPITFNVNTTPRKKGIKRTRLPNNLNNYIPNKDEDNEKTNLNTGKPIRFDINLDEISDFFEYLKNREPNRQERERYIKSDESSCSDTLNEYRHSTFIDNKRYRIDARKIEVFVNGKKSKDFNIKIKEYNDSIEIYLSYRWKKGYERSDDNNRLEAIQPVERKRINRGNNSKNGQKKGKKIFVTIEYLSSWMADRLEKNQPVRPSVKYIEGEPGAGYSTTLQLSSIKETVEDVNISINGTTTKSEEKLLSSLVQSVGNSQPDNKKQIEIDKEEVPIAHDSRKGYDERRTKKNSSLSGEESTYHPNSDLPNHRKKSRLHSTFLKFIFKPFILLYNLLASFFPSTK